MADFENKLNYAINKVFEELNSLSAPEFLKELEKYKDDHLTHMLIEADGPTWHTFWKDFEK